MLAHAFALGDHLRKFVAADGFTKSGLGAHVHRIGEVLDFENGFFGVPHQPEDNRVDVDRDGVSGERGFGGHGRDTNALIDKAAERVHDGHDEEDAGAAQAAVAAKTEDGDALPLLHNLDREHEIDADCDAGKQRSRRMKQFAGRKAGNQTHKKGCDSRPAYIYL